MKRVKQKWCKRFLWALSEIQILCVFVKMKSLDLRGFVTCTYLLCGITRAPRAGIVLPSPTWDPGPLPTAKCFNWERLQPKHMLSTFNIRITCSVGDYKNRSTFCTCTSATYCRFCTKSKGLVLRCRVPLVTTSLTAKGGHQAFASCLWSFPPVLRG